MSKNEKLETSIESVMEIFSNIALAKPQKLDDLLEQYTFPIPQEKRPAPNKYSLKKLVGYKDHDITKVVLPAYTIPKDGKNKKQEKDKYECCEREEKVKKRCGQKGFTFARAPLPEINVERRLDLMYDIKNPSNCSKKFVWGRRTRLPRRENPPPNMYNLPKLNDGPQFALKGLIDLPKPLLTPGPLNPSVTLTKPSSKGIRIGTSVRQPSKAITPAPSAYRRECVWENMKSSPKFSFGIRYSPKVIIPIV